MNADSLFSYASQRMNRGDFRGAVESFRAVLANDPDRASAHALLSVCLLRTGRRFAAEHEARLALSLDPQCSEGHVALGWVHRAHHALDEAEASFKAALRLHPDPFAELGLSEVDEARGDFDAAKGHAEKVLAMAPHAQALLQLADVLRKQGRSDEAEVRIDEALAHDPENASALAAKGECFLRRGELGGATLHAHSALRVNSESPRGLALFVNVKTRANPFLGMWWRLNTWLTSMTTRRRILALVGLYTLANGGSILAAQSGAPTLSRIISFAWVLFALYTWVGIPMYKKMLRRELNAVELGPDY